MGHEIEDQEFYISTSESAYVQHFRPRFSMTFQKRGFKHRMRVFRSASFDWVWIPLATCWIDRGRNSTFESIFLDQDAKDHHQCTGCDHHISLQHDYNTSVGW